MTCPCLERVAGGCSCGVLDTAEYLVLGPRTKRKGLVTYFVTRNLALRYVTFNLSVKRKKTLLGGGRLAHCLSLLHFYELPGTRLCGLPAPFTSECSCQTHALASTQNSTRAPLLRTYSCFDKL